MLRQWRMEYPGAIDAVMNRGDRREPILDDDTDRKQFSAQWHLGTGTHAASQVAKLKIEPEAQNEFKLQ